MPLTIADYEEVLKDHRRLVRELDVAMHGEENAAKQASLCDLIEPARELRETNKRLIAFIGRQRIALESARYYHVGNGDRMQGSRAEASLKFVMEVLKELPESSSNVPS